MYRFTTQSVERLSREWTAVVRRDYSHPCIVAWVPINESWGVPNLPDNPRERHYVQALYHLTKTLDATRPVVGNDGWESVATDIIGVHDYDDQPERLGKRYLADDMLPAPVQTGTAPGTGSSDRKGTPLPMCRSCSPSSAALPSRAPAPARGDTRRLARRRSLRRGIRS